MRASALLLSGFVVAGAALAQFDFEPSEPGLQFGEQEDATKFELVSAVTSIQPGQPFVVGLRQTIDEHWHTFWRHSGTSGESTKMKWTLPDGFSAGGIEWPTPERHVTGNPPYVEIGFGYEHGTMLLVTITPPEELAPGEVTLRAEVTWQECLDDPENAICVQGSTEVSLTLPVADGEAVPDPEVAEEIEEIRKRLPRPGEGWSAYAYKAGTRIAVDIKPPSDYAGEIEAAEFWPATAQTINLEDTGGWTRTGGIYRLVYPVFTSDFLDTVVPDRFEGILVGTNGAALPGGEPAVWITVEEFGAKPPADWGEAAKAQPPEDGPSNFWVAALFMFLGGLILNLMPCVFPVISLKVLGFVQHAKDGKSKAWQHGLVFALGVLVSFWIVAGVFIALKATVGWGFQLQDPRFVLAMAVLFLVIGLNLFGLFEFGGSLTGVGQGLQAKSGFAGSFFSGVLATLVATPCTAPFMGSAIPFAVSLPAVLALALFTCLGLGMALPYVLLSSSPPLLERMPRPGPWMVTFKQVLGFAMLGTVIWMVWVFVKLELGLVRVLSYLLVISLAFYVTGRLTRGPGSRAKTAVAWVVPVAVIALGGVWALKPPYQWPAWSPEAVQASLKDGRPVFVDFTAAWCATCQVNKKAALHREEVLAAFEEKGVTVLQADYTAKDPMMLNAIRQLNRRGVPVYPLYRAEGEPPVLLPNVLTPGIVLDALEGLDTAAQAGEASSAEAAL